MQIIPKRKNIPAFRFAFFYLILNMKEYEDIIDKKSITKILDFSAFKHRKSNKRVLVKKKGDAPKGSIQGIVVASTGKNYLVSSNNDFYDCIPAGTIISDNGISSLIAVGDHVSLLPDTKSSHTEYYQGAIVKVEDRYSWLTRKEIRNPNEQVLAANIDRLMIIMAAAEPFYNKRLIDRYLVAAQYGNLEPVICVNKMDLMDRAFIEEDFNVYKEMGLKVLYVSAKEKTGFKELMDAIYEKGGSGLPSTVLSGPSGVGKSTIINEIFGKEIQFVNDISDKTTKGRHTTSFTKMFGLPDGGFIIDTPGIREYGLFNINRDELALYFHDFDDYYDKCKYMPCTHTHEPHCAVKEAVESGEIDAGRYESYLNIFESLEE